MTTTFRQDVAAGIVACLSAYATAHPGALARVYDARPEGLTELPLAYIDGLPETVEHSSGVRIRTMTPSIVLIDRLALNAETASRMHALVDGVLDALTASPHLAPGTVWSSATIRDSVISVGPSGGEAFYAAVTISIPDLSIHEGRD